MDGKLYEIAERIKSLRELLEIGAEEMAEIEEMSVSAYLEHESGTKDFSFTFLYKAANRLGVDIAELLTGENPKLSLCSIVRRGEGLSIERRSGFTYQNMAYLFKNRISEPFVVNAPYEAHNEDAPITLSAHTGQEFDFVLSGSLRMRHGEQEFTLNEGDGAYYDSSRPHGMVAVGGKPAVFLAVVMKDSDKPSESGDKK